MAKLNRTHKKAHRIVDGGRSRFHTDIGMPSGHHLLADFEQWPFAPVLQGFIHVVHIFIQRAELEILAQAQ
jgi:hypothetical protein